MSNLMSQPNKINYPKTVSLVVAVLFFVWAVGCQPTVPSLRNPAIKVTAPQLQVELEALIAQFDIRKASLEEQGKFRELVLNNALLVAEGGTLNPVGILTGLLAFYGVGSGINDGRKAISKLKKK